MKKLIDYLVNDLGVQPNVAVSIIFSLLTFSLGFIITWGATAISKFIKRRNYKKILKIIIHNFLESCKKQYLQLEDFSKQKGFLHGENYHIKTEPNFGLNYLSALDIKIFIENFSSSFKKSRAAEICELFEIIELVKTSKDSYKEQIKGYYSNYADNLKKYNENITAISQLQNELAVEYNEKPSDNKIISYILSINDIFTKWENNGGNYNVHTTNTELINPLFDGVKTTPPNPISLIIITYCINCRTAVADISSVEKYIKEEIAALLTIHKLAYQKGSSIFAKW